MALGRPSAPRHDRLIDGYPEGMDMAAPDVIVGLDDSDSAAAALLWSARYARLHGLRLLGVHVSPFLVDLPPHWTPEDAAYDPRSDDELGPVAARTRSLFQDVAPEPGWALLFVGGPPGRALVDLAHDRHLLAVGARKHGRIGRLLAGSVSHYCLSHSTVPVAAVPAPVAAADSSRSDEIVVGLDDSPSGRQALSWAAALARCSGERVRALHLLGWPLGYVPKNYPTPPVKYLPPDQIDREYRAGIADLFKLGDPEPGWHLEFAEGHPGKALVRESETSALLVVGTQEQVGLGRLLLGSVSHYALNHASCPVVAVPATFPSSPPTSDVRTTSS